MLPRLLVALLRPEVRKAEWGNSPIQAKTLPHRAAPEATPGAPGIAGGVTGLVEKSGDAAVEGTTTMTQTILVAVAGETAVAAVDGGATPVAAALLNESPRSLASASVTPSSCRRTPTTGRCPTGS